MPPSIGFFSITVCNTTSLLYICIYILFFSVIWKKMWPISSEKIYSQANISVNEPPSLLTWHKLQISAVPITQQAARSWAANYCMTFTAPSFHVSLHTLHFPMVLLWSMVVSRSRLQPYWEAVHWEWIVGFEFLLSFKACQRTAEQHHAAYYPPRARSAAAARVIANTTGASAHSESKLSVLRRHYVFRERERTSMLIYQKWLQHWMCVVCFEDSSY